MQPTRLIPILFVVGCGNSPAMMQSPDMAMMQASCVHTVACTDNSVQSLNLFRTVNAATITDTPSGSEFTSAIDATAAEGKTTAEVERGLAAEFARLRTEPPTAEELSAVLTRLGLEPWDVVRHNEAAAKPLRDLPRDAAHRADWIQAMVSEPILIQRPIITADDVTPDPT